MHLGYTGRIMSEKNIQVALAGNPNCGKTSIFNALTGSRHHVGNWAGVTVEKRSGSFDINGTSFELVDLPGTYSLSAQSEDERIASDFLASSEVDFIINVLDASNLERNLYLTSQLLELQRPILFVLNMMDDAEKLGIEIHLETLSQLLGGPVVPVIGNRQVGIPQILESLARMKDGSEPSLRRIHVNYGEDIEGELAKVGQEINRDERLASQFPTRWTGLQLLEGTPSAQKHLESSHAKGAIGGQVTQSQHFLEKHLGADTPTLLAERRYGFVHGLVQEAIQDPGHRQRGLTDRLDAVITHRVLGLPIFLAIMTAVYSLTFLLGKFPQEWIADGFAALHGYAQNHLPAGELSSLLVDGIIPGVGAVVVFVPIIMLLMGAIAFLEDTGYMARAAFIMDRLMHLMGLHGKSFIPLIMGTGCNVPAVQATRTIEAKADRTITILVSPLVSCSARLQVYVLIAGTFFPPFQAALAIIAMHFLGFILAMVMGKLLRLTLFRKENTPFVMELPPYRMPVLKSTFIHMWEKGRVFLSRAGTVILAGATLVWFLSHYPGITNREWSAERLQKEQVILAQNLNPEAQEKALSDLNLAHESRIMNSSLAARFGKFMEPALSPILDPDDTREDVWKDGVALTAGFVAKEIVVGTLAVVHQASADRFEQNHHQSPLQDALKKRSGLTPLTALAFMVFTLIYTPCLGTLSMIYKETKSLAWTSFSLVYSLVLAWVLAFLTIQLGRMFF